MARTPDPSWLRLAERAFAVLLWLFPRKLRDAHGEEMRQTFRDRCRESARGERGAVRALAFELLPDTLRSAAGEQVHATFGQMRPRQYFALGLLCCAALGLLFNDSLTRHTLDVAFKAKYWLRDVSDARELEQREAKVRRVAEHLIASDDALSKGLGAYLYRSLLTGRMHHYEYSPERSSLPSLGLLQADSDRASAAVAAVGGETDTYALAVAVRACSAGSLDCSPDAAIARLTARQPDNAYGWSLAFKRASARGDQTAMRAALQQAAGSLEFEDYNGRIVRDVSAAAQAVAPNDVEILSAVLQQLVFEHHLRVEHFEHDVRYACRAPTSHELSYARPRWLASNPDMKPACLALARLLTRSTDAWSARWGWRQLFLQAADESIRAQLLPKLRDSQWLDERHGGGWTCGQVPRRCVEWTAAEWKQMASAWAPGDGELPSIKRWLSARGIPTRAPESYQGHP